MLQRVLCAVVFLAGCREGAPPDAARGAPAAATPVERTPAEAIPLDARSRQASVERTGAETPVAAAESTAAAPAPAVGAAPSSPLLARAEEATRLAARLAEAEAASGDEAIALYDAILVDAPRYAPAIAGKLRVLESEGQLAAAIEILDTLLARDGDDPRWISEKARLRAAGGELDRAIATLEAALEGDALLPGLRFERARYLARAGREDDAVVALADAVAHGFLGLEAIEGERDFAQLAADPRFQDVVAKLRARRAGYTSPAALREIMHQRRLLDEEEKADPHPDLEIVLDGDELLSDLHDRLTGGYGREVFFDLTAVDGRPLRLPDFIGKPLLVIAWGTWSPFSKRQLDQLIEAKEALDDAGVAVITLAYVHKASPDIALLEVESALAQKPLPYRTAVVDRATALELGIERFPTTLFLGANGAMYLNRPGLIPARALRVLAAALVNTEAAPVDPKAIYGSR